MTTRLVQRHACVHADTSSTTRAACQRAQHVLNVPGMRSRCLLLSPSVAGICSRAWSGQTAGRVLRSPGGCPLARRDRLRTHGVPQRVHVYRLRNAIRRWPERAAPRYPADADPRGASRLRD
jgi:hypothetical protein